MERVTFLIEATGARVSCLLNPEDLEARRAAGLVRRIGAQGALTGQPRRDDPLVATGGGVTEYDVRLLFDMDIATEAQGGDGGDGGDVRDRTRPLWDLAENAEPKDGFGAPPLVRFIWGKAWNVPGVIIFVSERLERFDASGRPQRSWLSLRLRRMEPAKGGSGQGKAAGASGKDQGPQTGAQEGSAPAAGASTGGRPAGGGAPRRDGSHQQAAASQRAPAPVQTIPVDPTGLPLIRLDQIAAQRYGDPAHALTLAAYNAVEDPLNLPPQTRLTIPAAEALARRL